MKKKKNKRQKNLIDLIFVDVYAVSQGGEKINLLKGGLGFSLHCSLTLLTNNLIQVFPSSSNYKTC